MTILHLLRNVTRAHLESHFAQQLCQARALTGAEAVNALRPFYFAVHPDFFGQYPEEREVNENSLKRLNGYLESLQKPGRRSLKPLPLTFYIRDAADRGFRTVNFTLETTDIQSTVLVVLKSCSLSADHIHPGDTQQQNKLVTSVPFYRPIRWDKTYYAFTGYKDPEEELELAKKVEPKLGLWLIRNEARATKKQKESLSLRSELKRLKKDLCQHLGLSDIRWQRSWALAHKCSQLHSLGRLSQQNPEAVKGLQGHTVIFTDQSGINAAGNVMLGTTDVHHQWAKMLEKLPNYSKLLVEASNLEERISHLLGGMQVIYIEKLQPLLMAEEYYSMLSAFYKRLLAKRIPFHPRSLEGLQMTLENDCSRPRLDDLGHFNIPIMFDPSTLHWFVQTNAQEARQRIKRKEELEEEENALVLICAERLSLKRLYKESSISNTQMIPCCQRLIEEGFPLLQGMYLCVSHFYSVLQDGDMCIPWDWKK